MIIGGWINVGLVSVLVLGGGVGLISGFVLAGNVGLVLVVVCGVGLVFVIVVSDVGLGRLSGFRLVGVVLVFDE